VTFRPGARYDPDAWYWDVPVVGQLRAGGLTLDCPVTVLVGENGCGKSTLVEALAAAWGRRLTAQVHAIAAGSQVVLATHSPLLAAFPGARVLELGDDGAAPRRWAELDLVQDWRDFMAAPERWLRHLAG
jgi:predicted ATPase